MIQMQVIDSLKEASKKDQALAATMTMFGLRERTRAQLTVRGLKQRMEAEGWKDFDEHDYKRVLKALADAGIGKLEKDGSGRVTALKEIKVTLQSLGHAVMDGARKSVERWRPRNQFTPVPKAPAPKAETIIMKPEPSAAPSQHPMRRASDKAPKADVNAEAITLRYNGKPVIVNVPEGFTEQEIAEFLVSLRSWRRASADNNHSK